MKKFYDKPAGIINHSDLRTFKGKCVYWTFFSVLVFVCLIAILPSIWVLLTGFKDSQEIYQSMSFFPKKLSFEIVFTRIGEALSVMKFGQTSLNTLIVSIGDVVFSIVIGGLGGYVLSRLNPTGSKLFFVLVVWTMMIPAQIRTVPLFISWLDFPFVAKLPGEVSLMNTYWPLWLESASSTFNIILFKNYFDSVSISLVEAAKIDGCGNGRIFFKIMMPLSKPIVMYVAIMAMKNAWSAFFTGYLVLQDAAIQTLPVRIYTLNSDISIKMNTYMLCLILSSVPMFILFMLFQKQIVGGINVGGVKG